MRRVKCYPFHRRFPATIRTRETRVIPDLIRASHRLLDQTPRFLDTFPIPAAEKLLAKVRYNRLIEIFLGIAAYSVSVRPATQ